MFKCVEYKTVDGIALEKLNLNFKYDEEAREISLSGIGGTLIMPLNRRISKFNGIKIWLFSPAKFDNEGILRIGENDVEKIIKPLLLKKYSAPSPIRRIVVDAGHGGHDAGAVGAISKEKDLNLSLALLVQKALENKGFEVLLTRSDDTFVTLEGRSEFALKHKADVFISIHHNASGATPLACGIECYSLTAAGMNSSHENGGKATEALPGNKFDDASINLNHFVQSHLINSLSGNDRGSKFARYRVLVNAPCPAILIEAGFVSNKKEELLINSESRQKKTAEAIAAAVEIFAQNVEVKVVE